MPENNHPEYDGSPVVWWGHPGASAYELATKNGFSGSLTEWLESLKGEPGDPGKAPRLTMVGDRIYADGNPISGKLPGAMQPNITAEIAGTGEPSVEVVGTYPNLKFVFTMPATSGTNGRVAHIGDSLTHRAGEENVTSWYRKVGFDATVYGCDGKEINAADTNGKTTLQNMADVRAANGEPGVWVIRLSTNLTSPGDGGVTMKAGMDAVIAAAGSTPIAWVSTATRDDLDEFEGGGWPFRYYVNEAIKQKVEAAGGLYIDLWQWTIANDPKDGSWWADGIHNTPLGYQRTYEYIAGQVASWVRG